jgi:cob(I)alamin adenosyltransferase
MKKSNVYTKTGDEGKTSLVGGTRALKSDLRIDLYGELDELNSRIGFLVSLLNNKGHTKEVEFLHLIQSALFDLGANMACEFENREKFKLPQLTESLVNGIELEIDRLDGELIPLKNFILPGGTLAASAIHLARTGTRNAERKMVHYQNITKEELPELSIIFLNRLSDYFFVLARSINKREGGEEILWKSRS